MSPQHSGYSREAIARRGDEIYERLVRAQVEAGNQGKVVAIDINTESYSIGENARLASKRLLAQHPEAVVWLVRIGHRVLHRMGRCPSRENR